MNGQHISGTPIVVDYWRLNNVPPRSLFFLTHMHADHTSGLSHRWSHTIHCTPVTAKLLMRKFKIQPKLVVELEVGESKILRVNTPNDAAPVNITVTTLDANHCPGSAMFLFEGYFGRILYTGDFRFCPSMLENPFLNGSRSIDILYLDNTYCDPQCNFPTRKKATEEVKSLINAHCDKQIIIGFHTLGKEDLLVDIANTFETYIGVSEEQYKTLELLEMPNVFTYDMEETNIQVYPFHMVSKDLLTEMKSNAIAILPTCLYTGQSALPPPSQEYIKVVPYSDHCSFPELRQFVESVRPRCVRPVVRSFSGDRTSVGLLRGNMSVFDDLLDPTPAPEIQIPSGIIKLLSTKSSGSSMDSAPPNTPLSHGGSIPKIRRAGSIGISHRNRPKGVQYLSPVKPMDYLPLTNSDTEPNGEEAMDENPVGSSDSPSANNRNNDNADLRDTPPHINEVKQSTTQPQVQQRLEDILPPPPLLAIAASNVNPRLSRARKTVSVSLESDSTCQRTSVFSLPTERVILSKKKKNNTTSCSCARVRLFEMSQLSRYREREVVDICSLPPTTHIETAMEHCSHTLAPEQPSLSKPQCPSRLPVSHQCEEEDTNSSSFLSKPSHTPLCDKSIVTPLPKLASPNVLEQLYGVEPARREMLTKNVGRLDKQRLNHSSAPSSEQPYNVNKKHRLEDDVDTSTLSTKRPRILPPDIFTHGNDNVSETRQDTTKEIERIDGCLLAKLEETGLLQKLKKVDLSSPAVVKIMHSALNAAQTISSCNPRVPNHTLPRTLSLLQPLDSVHVSHKDSQLQGFSHQANPSDTLPSSLPPLDCDTREESQLQGFTPEDNNSHLSLSCDECDGKEICGRGLEGFTHQDDRYKKYIQWIVTYDPFYK